MQRPENQANLNLNTLLTGAKVQHSVLPVPPRPPLPRSSRKPCLAEDGSCTCPIHYVRAFYARHCNEGAHYRHVCAIGLGLSPTLYAS